MSAVLPIILAILASNYFLLIPVWFVIQYSSSSKSMIASDVCHILEVISNLIMFFQDLAVGLGVS